MEKCPLYNTVMSYAYTDESYQSMTFYSLVEERWIFEDALTNANRWQRGIGKNRDMILLKGKRFPGSNHYENTVGLIGEFIFDGLLDRLDNGKGIPHYWAKPYYPPPMIREAKEHTTSGYTVSEKSR